MRLVLFCHSLVSCWNHGNAHFLRGIVSELLARGHQVVSWEPEDGWSRRNLLRQEGPEALRRFERDFPHLTPRTYADPLELDLDRALDGADAVLVHEWTHPALVGRLGVLRARSRWPLLFHDTHHRTFSMPDELPVQDLRAFDGVLAFGEVIRRGYLQRGWARRAWTWHEAADVRRFAPRIGIRREAAVVWIGNWGDEERRAELEEFLIRPVERLGLSATVHGVRYPQDALDRLARAGIRYRGWVPNAAVPEVLGAHAITVHVPRRPYARALPGIPTIRVFEALACGAALVCAPWHDTEGLFTPGRDYLVARDGEEMTRHLSELLADPAWARSLGEHGRATVLRRHTCAHRVDELLSILAGLGVDTSGAHPLREAS